MDPKIRRELMHARGMTMPHLTYVTALRSFEQYEFIGALRHRLRELPAGWLLQFGEFCDRFQGLTRHVSAGFEFILDTEDLVRDWLEVNRYPSCPPVVGLVRKYGVILRHTCETCGDPGKPYPFQGKLKRSLCPRCAAPHLLKEDISAVYRMLDSERKHASLIRIAHVPASLRPLLQDWARRCARNGAASKRPVELYPWDLAAWASQLAPIEAKLESRS
jgi:hypothetical protein